MGDLSIPAPPSMQPIQHLRRVLDIVCRLYQAILEQELQHSEWESPLTWYVGVSAFQLRGTAAGTWKRAYQHSPLLSRAIYSFRLVALASIFSPDRPDRLPTVTVAGAYFARYLHAHQPYILDSILSLPSLTQRS
jgi:hypothetical protein